MAQAMSVLVSSGHSLQSVWGYTIGQIFAFVKLAYKERGDYLSNLSSAVRMAYHAESKDFKEFLASLEQD